jgi:hypothetical protein
MTTTTPRDWLDADGAFIFGKYGRSGLHNSISGSTATAIARRDPDYIRWILENATDISNEDYRILEALVNRR